MVIPPALVRSLTRTKSESLRNSYVKKSHSEYCAGNIIHYLYLEVNNQGKVEPFFPDE